MSHPESASHGQSLQAPSFLARLERYLLAPVDASQLVAFRILFGILIALEAGGAILTGWVKRVFVEPEFTFKIPGFTWLEPLPGSGMYFVYATMALLGLGIALGFRFRLATASYLVLWTWCYLTQTSSYNNHYYLLVLLCFLLLLTPANVFRSLDAGRRPELRPCVCPRWAPGIFVLQIWIVYSYAAIAKLDPDWMAGKPVGIWFDAKRDQFLVGPLLGEAWFRTLVVWGGIFFDGLIVPLFLWRRTRLLAFALSIGFHLFNSITFRIGVFPYLALAFSVFFFSPEAVGRLILRRKATEVPTREALAASPRRASRALLGGLALYFLLQLALPLRHWLHPGNVHWTEEGHRMAWHMMVRAKWGSVRFRVRQPSSGRLVLVDPVERLGEKQALKIGARPDMIWQLAQRLAREYEVAWGERPEVTVWSFASLNGRKAERFLRPELDLAAEPWRLFGPNDWYATLSPD